MKNKENKIIIPVSQVVLYALLYLDKIDNIDLALIIKDIKDSYNIRFRGAPIENEGRLFLEQNDSGIISFGNSHSFHERFPGKDISIMDYILKTTKSIIKNYFQKFDVDIFKKKKEKLLNEVKENALEDSNILLISEYDSDYEELARKGFKNVQFFKSIILADKYFKDNPEKLELFDIVLFGESNVSDDLLRTELEHNVENLCSRHKMVKISFYPFKGLEPVKYHTYYSDYVIGNSFTPDYYNLSDLYDCIFNNIIINDTSKIISRERKFIPEVIDYSNVEKIGLPENISNLKIAFFNNHYHPNLTNLIDIINNQISLKLGVDVQFFDDNNFAFNEKLKENLGQFDIIIASDEFSHQLIRVREECNEQCKGSGRQFMMSIVYNDKNIKKYDLVNGYDDNGLGSKINLKYYSAGNLSESDEISEISYKVLRKKFDGNIFLDTCYSVIKSILEVVIGIYDKKLISITGKGLEGFKYKFDSPDEFTSCFEQAEEKYNDMINEKLESFNTFDSMISLLNEYLDLKSDALNGRTFKGLKVSQVNNQFLLHLYLPDSRLAAVLAVDIDNCNNTNSKVRTFELQTLNNKNNLSPKKKYIIGLDKDKCENEGYEFACENELKALNVFAKRINNIINYINNSENNDSYKKFIKQ